jgi:hypothetical protein
MHPFVAVMHRYCVEYLSGKDTSVCAQIMEPDYVLHMGAIDLGPRDDVYVPAVVRQLEQFPGLCMTVNELMINTEDRLAMRFTQHGASVRHDGRAASWGGIGLYKWNGTRLTSNYALEEYASRRDQLKSGVPRPVETPATAPWDEQPAEPSAEAEAAVRAWLLRGTWHEEDGVAFDHHTPGTAVPLLDAQITVIDDFFSAGRRVAFHVTQSGSLNGTAVTLCSVGVVSVAPDARLHGRVICELIP